MKVNVRTSLQFLYVGLWLSKHLLCRLSLTRKLKLDQSWRSFCQPKPGNRSLNLPTWGDQIVAQKMKIEAIWCIGPTPTGADGGCKIGQTTRCSPPLHPRLVGHSDSARRQMIIVSRSRQTAELTSLKVMTFHIYSSSLNISSSSMSLSDIIRSIVSCIDKHRLMSFDRLASRTLVICSKSKV